MGEKGYFLWHRQAELNFLHPLREGRKFTKYEAWQDTVGLAYFKDQENLVQGKKIVIERGSFVTAVTQLAERWKWNRRTVEKFLILLESEQMVTRSKVNSKNSRTCTILKINKYNDFQPILKDKCASECTTEYTTECTPKNKGNKRNKYKGNFIKPSIEEIATYCSERNNVVNPEQFFDYNESKGWVVGKSPMKDWKAAIRTWERNSGTNKENAENAESIIPG